MWLVLLDFRSPTFSENETKARPNLPPFYDMNVSLCPDKYNYGFVFFSIRHSSLLKPFFYKCYFSSISCLLNLSWYLRSCFLFMKCWWYEKVSVEHKKLFWFFFLFKPALLESLSMNDYSIKHAEINRKF